MVLCMHIYDIYIYVSYSLIVYPVYMIFIHPSYAIFVLSCLVWFSFVSELYISAYQTDQYCFKIQATVKISICNWFLDPFVPEVSSFSLFFSSHWNKKPFRDDKTQWWYFLIQTTSAFVFFHGLVGRWHLGWPFFSGCPAQIFEPLNFSRGTRQRRSCKYMKILLEYHTEYSISCWSLLCKTLKSGTVLVKRISASHRPTRSFKCVFGES